MSNLTGFLSELGQDARLMRGYKQNPVAVMSAYGVKDDEAVAVMAGDKSKLQSLAGGDEGQSFLVVYHGNDK
ncbi:hypothetical protein LZP73_10385 [Shewanella sp. AS16]|uniref:hypothetical protein n=1 Tax=Shewanella sp. AS16 TaxID=2907625 RepID=UPI001F3B38FF|nr:hypothetical protein [Shewanella sp. AS16]MCE9686612.1 hypothetical protein [Shewanella sp. AS16]